MAQLNMFGQPRSLRDIWREDATPKPDPDPDPTMPEADATAAGISRRVPDPHMPEEPAATTVAR